MAFLYDAPHKDMKRTEYRTVYNFNFLAISAISFL